MFATASSTTPPAAAPAPASLPLELLEARQLRDALQHLLRTEQSAMADFLVALADFDRRRGWEALGHANLFSFVRVELGLSRSGAYWRVSAARLVQRFPEVIVPLRDGRLCMSTTAELARVLTEENQDEVLPRYFGLSAREAQEVTAELAPRPAPPARDLVTRMEQGRGLHLVEPSGPEPVRTPTPTPPAMAPPTGAPVQTSGLPPAQSARVAAQRDDVEPLSADLRRLHVTVSRQFLKDLEAARDGLSHAIPGATTEQVLQAALRLLLEKQARARGQVKRPRTTLPLALRVEGQVASASPQPASSSSTVARAEGRATDRRPGPREAIPAAVRRAVWARDGGRCAWPLDTGGCCGSTRRLELDHVVPWARGGASTIDNLRLSCSRHNGLAARLAFGERTMARYHGVREPGAAWAAATWSSVTAGPV